MKSKKQVRKMNKSKKFRVMKGGGGSQSRPIVEGVITPHADVIKQLKYEFVYTTPFRREIAYLNDNKTLESSV